MKIAIQLPNIMVSNKIEVPFNYIKFLRPCLCFDFGAINISILNQSMNIIS